MSDLQFSTLRFNFKKSDEVILRSIRDWEAAIHALLAMEGGCCVGLDNPLDSSYLAELRYTSDSDFLPQLAALIENFQRYGKTVNVTVIDNPANSLSPASLETALRLQVKRRSLTKRLFMSLPTGDRVVSNILHTNHAPVFAEIVDHPRARLAQWDRAIECGATYHTCEIHPHP